MTVSTERVYYTNTYLDKLVVKILEVGKDENGSYVICDRIIFHPQGGGQPSDEGYLVNQGGKRYKVKKLATALCSSGLRVYYYEGEGGIFKGGKGYPSNRYEKETSLFSLTFGWSFVK